MGLANGGSAEHPVCPQCLQLLDVSLDQQLGAQIVAQARMRRTPAHGQCSHCDTPFSCYRDGQGRLSAQPVLQINLRPYGFEVAWRDHAGMWTATVRSIFRGWPCLYVHALQRRRLPGNGAAPDDVEESSIPVAVVSGAGSREELLAATRAWVTRILGESLYRYLVLACRDAYPTS